MPTSTARRATRAPPSWPPIFPSRRTISIAWPMPPTCTGSTSPSSARRCRSRAGSPTGFAPRAAPCSGPSAAAAQLEASKAFAKEVMAAARIPTASSRTFHDLAPALEYVARHPEPLVVKASGLAAGKGAVVCETQAEAAATVRAMLGDGDLRRGRTHRGDRIVPAGRRGLGPRDHRRQRRGDASRLPGPQAPAGGRTPDPTPAGWAPTARSRWPRRSCSSARVARSSCPRSRRCAGARHARSPACSTPA